MLPPSAVYSPQVTISHLTQYWLPIGLQTQFYDPMIGSQWIGGRIGLLVEVVVWWVINICSSKLEYEIKVKYLVVLSASQRPHQPVYL